MHSFVVNERTYFVLILLLYAVFVFVLAATRDYLGYDTETDFLASYVPDAKSVLSGEPLQGSFHPPGYPILLAITYALIGDWMTAGLVIAGLSGLVVVSTTYVFFDQLCGRAAAWGALLGLFSSSMFLRSSILATTDVYFLALFSSSCLLALRASSTGSLSLWAICGAIIGLATMTRTNGFTLILLLLVPFVSGANLRSGLRATGVGVLGLAAILVAFAGYAGVTGSNLLPSNTHVTFAQNYFAKDKHMAEGMREMSERFGSMAEVLLHDPKAIITGYLQDFYLLIPRLMLTSPLVLLFPVGLLVLVARFPNAVFLLFLASIVAQLLLVNFKGFHARFYLFLLPWIGASVGQLILLLLRLELSPPGHRLLSRLFVAGAIVTVGISTAYTGYYVLRHGAELAEVVPRVQGEIPEDAQIVARKPHIAFYTGGTRVHIPDLETVAELRDHLGSLTTDGPVFLFYGWAERKRQPQYAALANPSAKPDWLVEVARSSNPGDWVLFRFRASTPSGGPAARRRSAVAPRRSRASGRPGLGPRTSQFSARWR